MNKKIEFKNVLISNYDTSFIGDLTICNSKITKVIKAKNQKTKPTKIIMPAFIDSHTHGGYGFDFNNLINKSKGKDFEIYLNNIHKEGVMFVIPTTVTCSKQDLKELANKFHSLYSQEISGIKGWYMEGPFIAANKKGAHEEKYICPVDIKLITEINKQLTNCFPKKIAIAPEINNNLKYVNTLSKNWNVCLGHSDADLKNTLEAIKGGAHTVTHLYNRCSPYTHRDPGIVNVALDKEQKIYCEIIADGLHVDPYVVKETYNIVGADRIILISDSLSCKGLKDGKYKLSSVSIIKIGDFCYLNDKKTFAGSAKPYNKSVVNFKKMTNCSWSDLTKVTSHNVIKSLKMKNINYGYIKNNNLANFVVLDKNANLLKTYIQGKEY